MGGLIELILVFAFVLGFAVLELMSLRRYRKRKAADDAAAPDRGAGASPDSRHTLPDA